MDHASFALRQHLLVLHQAGIRHLLAPVVPNCSGPIDSSNTADLPGQTGADQAGSCSPAVSAAPALAGLAASSCASVLDQQPWAGFLGKMPQGAQSVWTYEGLGQDLTGQPSAERRHTLGRLLAAVRLPKGFVGFFPYCLPSGNALALHQDVFLEALSRLNPSSLVLFDDSQGHPLVQSLSGMADSRALLQYPSLDVFSRMNDNDLQAAAENLRASIFQGP